MSQEASVSLLIAGSKIPRGWEGPGAESWWDPEAVGVMWSWLLNPPQTYYFSGLGPSK